MFGCDRSVTFGLDEPPPPPPPPPPPQLLVQPPPPVVIVIAAAQVTVPPAPVAVPVYVVFVVGEVVVAPEATDVVEPMPLSIINEAAFVVVHDSIEDEPF